MLVFALFWTTLSTIELPRDLWIIGKKTNTCIWTTIFDGFITQSRAFTTWLLKKIRAFVNTDTISVRTAWKAINQSQVLLNYIQTFWFELNTWNCTKIHKRWQKGTVVSNDFYVRISGSYNPLMWWVHCDSHLDLISDKLKNDVWNILIRLKRCILISQEKILGNSTWYRNSHKHYKNKPRVTNQHLLLREF